MINMTTPQAKTTLNLMTQFRAMGRPWRMDVASLPKRRARIEGSCARAAGDRRPAHPPRRCVPRR